MAAHHQSTHMPLMHNAHYSNSGNTRGWLWLHSCTCSHMSMLPCIMSSLLMTMQTSRLNDHNDIQLKCYWSLGNGLDTVSSMRALYQNNDLKKKINHILFLFIDVFIYMLADAVVFKKFLALSNPQFFACKLLLFHGPLFPPTRSLKCIHLNKEDQLCCIFEVISLRLSRNLYFVFSVGVCGSLRVW